MEKFEKIKMQSILKEYRKGLEEIFGDRLKNLILYGSRARGEAREYSDIDVLCILKEPFDYGEMIRLTSELTASLSLKYDVVLSRVFVSDTDYRERNLPFFMNVRKEGVAV